MQYLKATAPKDTQVTLDGMISSGKRKCGTPTDCTAVAQYLKEIIPKVRRTKTTEVSFFFSELVILVVAEENGVLC